MKPKGTKMTNTIKTIQNAINAENVNKFTLFSDGLISYDGTMLYGVRQDKMKTRVWRRADGQEIKMPKERYSLSNIEGKREFFEDLIKVI